MFEWFGFWIMKWVAELAIWLFVIVAVIVVLGLWITYTSIKERFCKHLKSSKNYKDLYRYCDDCGKNLGRK